MEVFGPHNTSACLDINSISGSAIDPNYQTHHILKHLSMNDLKTCLSDIFDVEDTRSSTNQLNLSTRKDNIVNDVKECGCQVLETDDKGKFVNEKSLTKCTTFPPSSGSKSSINSLIGEKQEEEVSTEVSNGSSKPCDKCYSRSISLPVPLKPASAIRGSREKQGIPTKNLSVTWAPDVYDPVPTSTSHVLSNKNQNYRSNRKKSGRYKQKSASKSSQDSKGKDKTKKHVRRSGSGTRLKPFHEDSVTSFDGLQVDIVDFDVGTPDPFCGSSYLTKSVTNLHFSVAEAT